MGSQSSKHEMRTFGNEGSRSNLVAETGLKREPSQRLEEVVQFWTNRSSENLTDHKRSSPSKSSLSQMDWEDQKKYLKMAPSKGKIPYSNDEGNKSNFKSTAAQAGSFVNLRDNSIFKSRSHNKGSNASVHQKDAFSDPKSRSQSENFEHSKRRISKQTLRNPSQLDSSFDSKCKYSSDNLSVDSTVKTRDMDSRFKGINNTEYNCKTISVENVQSRCKNNDELKEYPTCSSNKSDDEENFPKDYIDARWQALCTSNDKELVLVPCPTCGRRFSQDAAYRHFPICSRMKEKGATAKSPKVNNRPSCPSPCSPSFINVMADDPSLLSKRDDGLGRKPAKPIVYTFTRNGQKNPVKTPEEKKKPTELSKQVLESPASSKQIAKFCSPSKFKKGSGNSISNKVETEPRSKKRKASFVRSDGVRKSASIWRKSIKEFKTIVDPNINSNVDKKGSHSSATDASSSSSKVEVITNTKRRISEEARESVASQENRICPTCGKLSNLIERNRIGGRAKSKSRKSLTLKHKGNNKPISRSVKDISNLQDLDIIPQSMRFKDNSKKSRKIETLNFDSGEDQNGACFCCGKIIPSSLMDSHTHLCQRIKNIEIMMSKDGEKLDVAPVANTLLTSNSKKQVVPSGSLSSNDAWIDNKEYCLLKQGNDPPLGTSSRTIASLKCPCCSQLLDLRLKY